MQLWKGGDGQVGTEALYCETMILILNIQYQQVSLQVKNVDSCLGKSFFIGDFLSI